MIVLACIRLSNLSLEELGHPSVANIGGVPNLFGACIYSFMCHHSLPSLVTPITPKKYIYRLFASDYILIAGFYLLLAFTGIFAFPTLNDLYTLNFIPDKCSPNTTDSVLKHLYTSGHNLPLNRSIQFNSKTIHAIDFLNFKFELYNDNCMLIIY